MSNSLPWVQLLLFLVVILAVNVFVSREGFDTITNPFSLFLESLITVDPEHGWMQGNYDRYDYDGSGNCPTPPTPEHHDHHDHHDHHQQMDESAMKTFYDTLKVDINEAIKNELMNEHNLNKPIVTDSSSTSCGTAQGKEMLDKNQKDCPQNVQPIDMSEYIRKDSIPCWGCSM